MKMFGNTFGELVVNFRGLAMIIAIMLLGLAFVGGGCRQNAEEAGVPTAGLNEGKTTMVNVPTEEDCGERMVVIDEADDGDLRYVMDRRYGICFTRARSAPAGVVYDRIMCSRIGVDPADHAAPEGCWK